MRSVKNVGIVIVCLIVLMCFVTSCFGIPFSTSPAKDVSKGTTKQSPTESQTIEPEAPVMPEIDVDDSQDDTSLSDVYAAYYELLTAAINEYGTGAMLTNTDGSPQIKGVIYAELIDFNNDGVPELLFMYGYDDFFASAICVVYTYTSGAVKQLGSYMQYLNHAGVDIAESRDGTAYLCYIEGDSFAVSFQYYTLVGDDWIEVLALAVFDEEIYDDNWEWIEDITSWYVDGNEVSEYEFTDALETYIGVVNRRMINIFDENYETVTNVLRALEALM